MAIGSRGEGGVGGGGRGTIFTGMGPKRAAPKKSTAKKAVLTKAQRVVREAQIAKMKELALKPKNIKINSAKSPTVDAARKANARALKAANKPTSKNNRTVGPKTSTSVADMIKNMKPANPKVTRGGSMKSRLNWPKSMTK